MRIFTAVLVATCLAIAATPDRAAAQGPYYPGTAQGWVGDPGPVYYPDRSSQSPRVWGSAVYLLAFRKSRQTPGLGANNPAGTPLANVGILSDPSTDVVFGGGLDNNPRSGMRGEVGLWLDGDAGCGVGASFLGLEQDSVGFSQTSDGSEIISRPIYNTLLDREASQLVSFPGLVRGTVGVQTSNDVYGGEIFLRKRIGFLSGFPFMFGLSGLHSLFSLPGTQTVNVLSYNQSGAGMSRCDFLMGYQFSRIEDSARITNNLVSLDPAFLGQIGTTLDAFDAFDTRNDFHGMTLGLKSVSYLGPWSLTMLGKVGLGNMRQEVTIDGQTIVTVPAGPTITRRSGLLTQTSNIGTYRQDRLGVIPEARIMLNYNFNRRLSAGVGYTFIYWNSVALAGAQMNTNVDVTQALPDPTFTFRESDSFVHAVTFRVQLNN